MTHDNADYRAAWNFLVGSMRVMLRSDLYVKDSAARIEFWKAIEAAWRYGKLPPEAGLETTNA